MMNTVQKQYIAEWHDSFVNYTASICSFVDSMKLLPEVTNSDKQAMDLFESLLHSKDVAEVEHDLSNGIIKKNTFDKIEKLNKDMVDFAVEHMSVSLVFKEVLKQISYHQIELNKELGIKKLDELQIPIKE